MAGWEDVLAIAARLPGVGVSTWYGTPALKAGGKGLCRLRTDPDALVVRVVDLEDREVLLQSQPDVFFSTPHYDGHPYVLVRLEAIALGQLAELLDDARRVVAPVSRT